MTSDRPAAPCARAGYPQTEPPRRRVRTALIALVSGVTLLTVTACSSGASGDTTIPGGPATSSQPSGSSESTEAQGHYFSVPSERAFAWADGRRSPFASGATVAIVNGMNPRRVLHVLAPHPSTPIESPRKVRQWTREGGYQQQRHGIEARPIGGGWTLVVDKFGEHALPRATIKALSARGTAVVMYEDTDLVANYALARHHFLVRSFDPVLYGKPWVGVPSRAEQHLRFDDHLDYYAMAKCMVLTQRLTHVHLTLSRVLSQRGRLAVGTKG